MVENVHTFPAASRSLLAPANIMRDAQTLSPAHAGPPAAMLLGGHREVRIQPNEPLRRRGPDGIAPAPVQLNRMRLTPRVPRAPGSPGSPGTVGAARAMRAAGPASGVASASGTSGPGPIDALRQDAIAARAHPGGAAAADQIDAALAETESAFHALTQGSANGAELFDQDQRLTAHVATLEDRLHSLLTASAALTPRGGSANDANREAVARTQRAIGQLRDLLADTVQRLDDRRTYLAHTAFTAPTAADKLYAWKGDLCRAGIASIDRLKLRAQEQGPALTVPQLSKLAIAKDALMRRADGMDEAARRGVGTLADAGQVLGRKKIGGLGVVKHFASWVGQKIALPRMVDRILSPRGEKLDHLQIDEHSLIEATIEQVYRDVGQSNKDARRDFRAEVLADLNNRPWEPIQTEIQVEHQGRTEIVHSQITPAADFIPSYGGKGVNCHCDTEDTHAVNLARTELYDADQQRLFVAQRHGVISAFGLVAKNFKDLDDQELAGHVERLLPGRCVRTTAGGVDVPRTARWARDHKDEVAPAMRRIANQHRADEVVQGALLSDPRLLDDAFRHAAALPADAGDESAADAPGLDVLSISLLTPDHVRKGVHSNEQMMLADQMQAWEDVSGPRLMTVAHPETGQPVRVAVNVRPVAVNYGVNQGALKGIGPFSNQNNFVSGWGDMVPVNEAALNGLLGTPDGSQGGAMSRPIDQRRTDLRTLQNRVDMLARAAEVPPGPSSQKIPPETLLAQQQLEELRPQLASAQREMQFIEELLVQVNAMRLDESYRSAGTEPYKMPVRLAVLGDLLGMKIAFNCKSGKDRTGEMDAECKFLRLRMELLGHVPPPEHIRTREEQTQLREVVTHSGNFEMQRLNTGLAGFKLEGVPEVYRQQGADSESDALAKNQKGTSGYTQS